MAQGFDIHAEGVAAAGRTACELAEALRAARSTWDGATRDGAAACGMDVVGEAFTAMQDAWFDEVGVHVAILEQSCEALGSTARDYADTDRAAAEAFDRGAR